MVRSVPKLENVKGLYLDVKLAVGFVCSVESKLSSKLVLLLLRVDLIDISIRRRIQADQ